jgi:hypothetical protein
MMKNIVMFILITTLFSLIMSLSKLKSDGNPRFRGIPDESEMYDLTADF